MHRISLLAVVFLAVAGLLTGPAWCIEVRMSAAEKKIEEALSSPTQMEFIETPLQDMVDYLKDFHNIEIQIDEKALEDVGVGTDTPITVNLKGVSLRSALNLILRQHELTYTIGNEVLLITTKEEAGCRLITRVYPVADLINRHEPEPGERVDGELADYDSLIDLITSTVKADSWNDVGGPGAICPATVKQTETLVISQTYEVHHCIGQLLNDLRLIANADPPAKSTPKKAPAGEAADPFGGS